MSIFDTAKNVAKTSAKLLNPYGMQADFLKDNISTFRNRNDGAYGPGYTGGTGTEVRGPYNVVGAETSTPSVQQSPSTQQAGGGAVTPSVNPDDINYLNDQESLLRQQLDRAQNTQNRGYSEIAGQYDRTVNDANTSRSRALEDFGVKGQQIEQGKTKAIGQVDTNARTLADSVRRMLGMASGSGSSAYKIAAPNAIARQASQQRTGVLDNFGQNSMALDTAQKRATEDFGSLLENLKSDRLQRESEFQAGIDNERNNIEQNLAEVARQRVLAQGGGYDQVKAAIAPLQESISNRTAAIDGLFSKYATPFSVKPVTVNTPELKDYTVDRAAIGQQGSTPQQYAPYSNFLKKDEETNKGIF